MTGSNILQTRSKLFDDHLLSSACVRNTIKNVHKFLGLAFLMSFYKKHVTTRSIIFPDKLTG